MPPGLSESLREWMDWLVEYSRHEDRKDMNSRRVTSAFLFATNAVCGFHVWINQIEAAEAKPTGTVAVSGSQLLRCGAAEEQHGSVLLLRRGHLEREIVAQRSNSRWRCEMVQVCFFCCVVSP